MDINEQAMLEIFYSGSHSFTAHLRLILNICFLLENDLLNVKKEKVSFSHIYHDYIEKLKADKQQ